MKALPPYSGSVHWKDYEIATPTFSLTPVEKPDMSPFLVHMTGKEEIAGILDGTGGGKKLGGDKGFLRASIPEQSSGNYTAKVVCFTESPTFALDFFRYRSFPRWKKDLRYGIGFSKKGLAESGVRPALYADNDLVKKIINAYEEFREDTSEKSKCSEILERLYPLCTPLLEGAEQEGFLWEREWRYPDATGLSFRHSDIRVICCPDRERNEVEALLGDCSSDVQFVRSWREFSDVTDYLSRQHVIWKNESDQLASTTSTDGITKRLKASLQQLSISLHSLEKYEINLQKAESELERVREEKASISAKIEKLKSKLKKHRKKQKTSE